MFWRIVTAVLVFIAAAIGFALVGAFLLLFSTESMTLIGRFLEDHSLMLGVVAGVCYFIWGRKLINGQVI